MHVHMHLHIIPISVYTRVYIYTSYPAADAYSATVRSPMLFWEAFGHPFGATAFKKRSMPGGSLILPKRDPNPHPPTPMGPNTLHVLRTVADIRGA